MGSSPAATMPLSVRQRRTARASVVGSILEWYDFFLFGAASAIVFNKLFFSAASPAAGTLASFATFGVGFAVRPIGGVLLAHLGDRIGRRPVLLLTVLLMGVSTFAIGFLPTYEQIGFWAPTLLVLCRLLQGFGVGAEYGGALVLSAESAKPEKRGFYASLPGSGQFIGVVLASGALGAVASLPEEQFLTWGWRIPFLASIIVVLGALVLRAMMPESEQFENVRESGRRERLPILTTLRTRPKAILLLIGTGCATAVASYSIQGYLPSYLSQQLGLSDNIAVLGTTIAGMVSIVTIPIAGALSDRIGRKPVIIVGGFAIAAFAYPFFLMINTRQTWLIWLAIVIGFALILNSIFAVTGSFYSEAVPTEVRYSGLVAVREFNGVIFAGTAPFMAALLVQLGNDQPWYLAGYMALSGIITAVCALALPETAPVKAGIGGDHVAAELSEVTATGTETTTEATSR
ncbi:putative MFS family arabinose efflux permease [Tamaricihabitans halophyticus]|uniref:Putative proline/betaine transporter n=1 Tax=Tamaricihabitans halophyticus TaxID=1262583 RepID=A0A4R2R128_9PSEU|nr:MFS transporter [Tamaricihabitans halophyticus]TCP56372.1 putative MFS family arabinose efflux permease [Tamaricihabitans halophyticus]